MSWAFADGRPHGIQSVSGNNTSTTLESINEEIVDADGNRNTIMRQRRTKTYVFSGLAEGSYLMVAAQENEARCFSEFAEISVRNANDPLVVGANDIRITPNSACATDSALGAIEILRIQRGSDPLHQGQTDLNKHYSFQWHSGTNAGISPPYPNPQIDPIINAVPGQPHRLENIAHGQYALVITKTSTEDGDDSFCQTEVDTTVLLNIIQANITDVTPTPLSHCANSNGSIRIDQIQIGNTGPVIPFTPTGFTTLDPTTFDANIRTHTNWQVHVMKGGLSISPTLSPTNPMHSTLAIGNDYQLSLYNQITQCTSTSFVFQIQDIRPYPDIDTDNTILIGNSVCQRTTTLNYNGAILARLDPRYTPTGLSYQWFLGQAGTGEQLFNGVAASNDIVPSGALSLNLSNLKGTLTNEAQALYSLRVTHNASQCSQASSFIIPNNLDYPELQTPVSHANIACTALNPLGKIILEPQHATPDNKHYTLERLDENQVVLETQTWNLSLSPKPTLTFDNLGAGTYFFRIIDTQNNCLSGTVPASIENDWVYPSISALVSTPNRQCDGAPGTPTGVVELTLTSPSIPSHLGLTNYNYSIAYFAADADTAIDAPQAQDTDDTDGWGFTNLRHNDYLLEIENTNTACKIQRNFSISRQDITLQPELLAGPAPEDKYSIPQSVCNNPNGRISVRAITAIGTRFTPPYSAFSFTWSNFPTGTTPPLATNHEALNLEAKNDYNLIIRHQPSSCAVNLNIDIRDARQIPVIALGASEPDKSCPSTSDFARLGIATSPRQGTGSLKVIPDGVADGTGYSFSWFEGNVPLGSTLGATTTTNQGTTQTITDKIQGQGYTCHVQNNNTGCQAHLYAEIAHETFKPIPIDFNVKQHTSTCTNTNIIPNTQSNGILSLTRLNEGHISDYSFYLFQDHPFPQNDNPTLSPHQGPINPSTGDTEIIFTNLESTTPVSYTHLTLPTNREV